MNKKEIKQGAWWRILLILATIAATITKLYIGIDHDESYVTVMGIRLLNGDRMFDTMWDLHMTSAWPVWLFAKLFYVVTGSLDGLVIYLRLVSVVLQFGTALAFYWIMKRYFHRDAVFAAAIFIANFLPRATQNLEYGLLEMLFVILAVTLLYDVLRGQEETGRIKWWKVAVAAVCYAIAVLAYPTIIISFPVLLIAMWRGQSKQQKRMPLLLWFTIICGVLAAFFVGYVLTYLPLSDLLSNLQGILNDGAHADVPKGSSYASQLVEITKRVFVFLVSAGVCYFIFRKWVPARKILLYDLFAVAALILIGFNITGIRPSGPLGLQVRYLMVAVIAVILYRCMEKRDTRLSGLFLWTGLAVYLGTMYGSNMGLEENASFLYLCLIVGILLAMEQAAEWRGISRCIAYGGVLLFVGSIIFTRGYLVRITGTGPANILEERVVLEDGVLRGVYVSPEEWNAFEERQREIEKYSEARDTILYLGDEAVCNTFTEGQFTAATCISTPVYNEEWVLYYKNQQHPQPTVIFVDKKTVGTWDDFKNTEFGSYLTERYEIKKEDVIEEEALYIYRVLPE